jgi:hypothetical protein
MLVILKMNIQRFIDTVDPLYTTTPRFTPLRRGVSVPIGFRLKRSEPLIKMITLIVYQ